MDALEPIVHEVPVLVVGGGPVGMIAAIQLAHHGVHCMLAERNMETTRWPKMDITNCRSMELLRRLRLANGLRKQGVPQDYSFDVIFSSGLGDKGEKIAKWDLPSPDEWRAKIRDKNDGSMPREPYQRCSQAIFEAWLKPIIDVNPLIDCYFGLKFEILEETVDRVISRLLDTAKGQTHIVKSKFVVACDGAGSRVRKTTKLNLTGGPVPAAMLLVHFKSRDLTRLQKQGQFWHIFFTHGGVIISQDEVDTWTTHLPLSLDEDIDQIDPKEAVFKVLGGHTGPFPIAIDKVLVKSSWRPNLTIADGYRTKIGRVFLAGDSGELTSRWLSIKDAWQEQSIRSNSQIAHQNIPTGGYGMNMGVGDAYDIGWKLAAVINGYGGEYLLQSYTIERRPVALRNVNRSGVHHSVHSTYCQWAAEKGPDFVLSDTEEARKLKSKIAEYVRVHDGENKDHGIEMGYAFPDSPVVTDDGNEDGGEKEMPWNPRHYIASTRPGVRAPHIFLADGKTSIFDLYGEDYTIVDFTWEGTISKAFEDVATDLHVPLKPVHLPDESHARSIWQRDIVLVRPDGFVSWRSANPPQENLKNSEVIQDIILISVGQRAATHLGRSCSKVNSEHCEERNSLADETPIFTGSIGNVAQDTGTIEKMGEFQM